MVLVAGADTTRGAALARACAHDGAAVVLVGGDGESLGSLAAELTAAGARVAVFAGDPNVDSERAALAELLDELF
jgi:short-subunit dehydrogenase